MTFIVTLVTLLIERFFDWSHLRHWNWYSALERAVSERMKGKSPYLKLAATIIPLLLAVLLIEYLLQNVLYGFAKLVFDIVIVLYCFGPKDLWADAFACTNALNEDDAQSAKQKVKAAFSSSEADVSLHKHVLNNIFIEANRRVFAVVFWYVLLGALGAVLYRAVTLSADASKEEADTQFVEAARSFEALLNWVPIRIFTFLFALGGHFGSVLSSWRKSVLHGLDSNEVLLTECGVAALGNGEEAIIAENGTLARHAVSLLDRVFVITLVLVAIVVMLR